MFKKFGKALERPFYYVTGICSVASVVLLCFKDNTVSVIALLVFSISLCLFLWGVFRVLNRFLEKQGEDHKCISSFIHYRTDDGENFVIESYKLIQAKCSIMHEFNSGFKWSGEKIPVISSDLQSVKLVTRETDKQKYDQAVLAFRKPLLYNETAVVHFKAKVNDAEKKSLPYIEIPVKYPVEYVQICISLGYKDNNVNATAKISKRLIISEIPQDYCICDSISFDQQHKQYLYRLINPEVGYFYKITWE